MKSNYYGYTLVMGIAHGNCYFHIEIMILQLDACQGDLRAYYINDIVNTSDKFNFLMYADDTTLIGSDEFFLNGHSNESTEDIITKQLIKISTWMEINKLLINESKTKIMFFYNYVTIVH